MREHRGRTTTGRWWAGWLGVWWLVGGVPLAWAADRTALVIGNARYLNERPLVNTLNDARAVADQLRGLGFAVTLCQATSKIDPLATSKIDPSAGLGYSVDETGAGLSKPDRRFSRRR
jgi:hypothetical protein